MKGTSVARNLFKSKHATPFNVADARHISFTANTATIFKLQAREPSLLKQNSACVSLEPIVDNYIGRRGYIVES